MRIRTGWHKSLFVILLYLVSIFGGYAGVAAGVPEYIRYEFSGAMLAFGVYVGTRIFRGQGEDVAPPRPWWRMSARPTASFVLAAFFFVRSVFATIVAVDAISYGWIDLQFLALCAVDPLIFAAYLNSGIRLARMQRPPEPSLLPGASRDQALRQAQGVKNTGPSSSSGR